MYTVRLTSFNVSYKFGKLEDALRKMSAEGFTSVLTHNRILIGKFSPLHGFQGHRVAEAVYRRLTSA